MILTCNRTASDIADNLHVVIDYSVEPFARHCRLCSELASSVIWCGWCGRITDNSSASQIAIAPEDNTAV